MTRDCNISVVSFPADDGLSQEEVDDLQGWLKVVLGNKVHKTKVSSTARCRHDTTGVFAACDWVFVGCLSQSCLCAGDEPPRVAPVRRDGGGHGRRAPLPAHLDGGQVGGGTPAPAAADARAQPASPDHHQATPPQEQRRRTRQARRRADLRQRDDRCRPHRGPQSDARQDEHTSSEGSGEALMQRSSVWRRKKRVSSMMRSA